MAPSPASVVPSPVPPPVPVATHPNRGALKPPTPATSNHLSPEDAYYATLPPRLRPLSENKPGVHSLNGPAAANAAAAALRPAVASLRQPPAIPLQAQVEQEKKKRRSATRRRQAKAWKKLLWVKQTYPDNYTDEQTFLDHLQRPRVRLYDFWPLVADSTIIVQHVSSVVIYVCCFVGIYQDRVSPTSILTCGSLMTVLGWLLWDHWVGQEAVSTDTPPSASHEGGTIVQQNSNKPSANGLGLIIATYSPTDISTTTNSPPIRYPSGSTDSNQSPSQYPLSTADSPSTTPNLSPPDWPARQTTLRLSPRMASKLKTMKSAVLIYAALLGLSPILKSLTKSTAPDSVWALATWLMIMNIVFFDYGGIHTPRKRWAVQTSGHNESAPVPSSGESGGKTSAATFPASLSTNAALMASTVLASRLPTTTHVFSLTMFSIQVFGLFPVFRRHLRHISLQGHLTLTMCLVVAASGGVGIILGDARWAWLTRALLGTLFGSFSTAFVCGACSWWLIGLQRYKNVVKGPWDVARPVLKGRARGMTES